LVDAFTRRKFAGNSAAVCVLEHELDVDTMQHIAMEMNLAETAFVSPISGNVFRLRWFTPTVEVALCGHATLATAHVLYSEKSSSADVLHFDTMCRGRLSVSRLQGGALQMDFPSGSPVAAQLSAETRSRLAQALGAGEHTFKAIFHCAVTRKLLVEVDSVDTVLALKPNTAAMTSIDFGAPDVKGVIVTAAGSTGGSDARWSTFDCVSRYFAPWVGIPEDPVTGSAHTVLAVYWSDRLKKPVLRAFQASARGGEMETEVKDDRVLLRGQAITVSRGLLDLS